MESFNGKLRDECLNISWFWNPCYARRKISTLKLEYNCRRSHSSLGSGVLFRLPMIRVTKTTRLNKTVGYVDSHIGFP
jgi:transposase InsO family protein